jgi:hypothetical protein
MRKTYIILGILIIGILAGTIFVMYEWNRKPQKVSDVEPAYTITTTDLLNAFKADTAAAGKKYNDAIIQVSGTADEVEDSKESINVLFHGDGVDLECSFMKKDNKGVTITPKSQITLKGKYTGYIVDDIFGPKAELTECVLMK